MDPLRALGFRTARDFRKAIKGAELSKKKKRELFYGAPSVQEFKELTESTNPLDQAILELWRGRAPISSVHGARLSREKADAILVALGETTYGDLAVQDAALRKYFDEGK